MKRRYCLSFACTHTTNNQYKHQIFTRFENVCVHYITFRTIFRWSLILFGINDTQTESQIQRACASSCAIVSNLIHRIHVIICAKSICVCIPFGGYKYIINIVPSSSQPFVRFLSHGPATCPLVPAVFCLSSLHRSKQKKLRRHRFQQQQRAKFIYRFCRCAHNTRIFLYI